MKLTFEQEKVEFKPGDIICKGENVYLFGTVAHDRYQLISVG